MKISAIIRDNDVIYGNKDLETLFEFKKFPIFMGASDKNFIHDKFFKMKWQISKASGVLQLNPLLPLKILYPETHNSGCVGKLWETHHYEFAKFIEQYKPSNVLEIGASHGILFQKYLKLDKKINWTIIEPNPKINKNIRLQVIKSFFDSSTKISSKIDTVIHSHVIEHIYDLHKFMENLGKKISKDNYMIFSVPNLEIMLKKKYTNCLNFEHTIFLTQPFIKFYLDLYGFKIVKKKLFKKDHSIFYACKKISIIKKNKDLNFYKEYKNIFLNYIKFNLNLILNLNKIISKSKKPIFLFGGHVFSQSLINFGLKTKKIICILDNDLQKYNKRLYGTKLVIKSPQILSTFKNPIVILKAGVYTDEIKKDILKNINSKTTFI